MKYVKNEENGLKQIKEITGVEFALQYEPINFKLLKKVKNKSLSSEQYNNEINEMIGSQYFILRIKLTDSGEDLLKYEVANAEEYSERVQYFSFGIQNDFYLLEGADSLKCKLFHFERSYGISGNCTLLLGFDSNDELIKQKESFKEKVIKDKILVYNDKVFGLGPIKYSIKKEDINNIPELIIE